MEAHLNGTLILDVPVRVVLLVISYLKYPQCLKTPYENCVVILSNNPSQMAISVNSKAYLSCSFKYDYNWLKQYSHVFSSG